MDGGRWCGAVAVLLAIGLAMKLMVYLVLCIVLAASVLFRHAA